MYGEIKILLGIQGSSIISYRTPNARRTYNKVMIEKKFKFDSKNGKIRGRNGDQNWGNIEEYIL